MHPIVCFPKREACQMMINTVQLPFTLGRITTKTYTDSFNRRLFGRVMEIRPDHLADWSTMGKQEELFLLAGKHFSLKHEKMKRNNLF